MQALDHPPKPPSYHSVPDERLVLRAAAGDELAMEYLIAKYRRMVRLQSRAYFLLGADHEDLVQEGMIGLYKGIRDFDPDKIAHFRTFAELCITRQIITAIKSASRRKHMPLNQSLSLDRPIFEGEKDRTLNDVIADVNTRDPIALVLRQDFSDDFRRRMVQGLSDTEGRVLDEHLQGKSYLEIAKHLGRTVKSVDNALQRVKRKLALTLAGIETPA